MKIAITTQEEGLEAIIDQRFGRSKYFVIVQTDDNHDIINTKSVLNEGTQQGHGAGIKASEQMGKLGVDVVITGNLGPNSTTVLNKLGIKTYQGSGTVNKSVNDLFDNKLQLITDIAEPHSDGDSEVKENKHEKVFFPLLNNDGKNSQISQHFGHAPFFGIYDVEDKKLSIVENNLDHSDPTKSPIDQIQEAVNPTTIFAKGIGGRAIGIIAQKGLKLKTGDYDIVGKAIENLDKLENQTKSCGH